MATVLLHPRHGESFSPKQLNMLVLKRFMDFHDMQVTFMKRRPNGDILLKTTTYPEPDFDGEKIINGVPVEISMPSSMNYHKGIIHHTELQYMNLEEVWELLQNQVHRLTFKAGDGHAIVFFKKNITKELPATIQLGWDRVKVKPCQPRPIRCFKCQQYGHIADDCRNSPVCAYCAGEHATSTYCRKPSKCAACGGLHVAYAYECPKWKEEKAIVALKHKEKISYREALLRKKKEQEEQEAQKHENQEEQNTEEDSEPDEEEQDSPPQEPRTKRKLQQEDDQDDDTSSEEDSQAAPPKAKSGNTPDTPGGWHVATSRRKRK